jgi:hypothetical protein
VVGLFPNEVAVIRLVGAILANTTVAAGDTAEEIDKLRRGGGGHIVVWGGVNFWRSLMRLDLIDEFRLDLYPHVAGEGTGCSTTSPSPTGSTWSPAPRSATGPSGSLPPAPLTPRPPVRTQAVMAMPEIVSSEEPRQRQRSRPTKQQDARKQSV